MAIPNYNRLAKNIKMSKSEAIEIPRKTSTSTVVTKRLKRPWVILHSWKCELPKQSQVLWVLIVLKGWIRLRELSVLNLVRNCLTQNHHNRQKTWHIKSSPKFRINQQQLTLTLQLSRKKSLLYRIAINFETFLQWINLELILRYKNT